MRSYLFSKPNILSHFAIKVARYRVFAPYASLQWLFHCKNWRVRHYSVILRGVSVASEVAESRIAPICHHKPFFASDFDLIGVHEWHAWSKSNPLKRIYCGRYDLSYIRLQSTPGHPARHAVSAQELMGIAIHFRHSAFCEAKSQNPENSYMLYLILLLLLLPLTVFGEESDGYEFPAHLSELGLFSDEKRLEPVPQALPFTVTSPLFSDHAGKERFALLPQSAKILLANDGRLVFPDGAMLVKSFYYAKSGEQGGRLVLETRVLRKHAGEWYGVSYRHDPNQDSARRVAGGSWIRVGNVDTPGAPKLYRVPSQPQCSACHAQGKDMLPIGPNLNLLEHTSPLFARLQQDVGTGDIPEHSQVPDWSDQTLPALTRARAYLHANCAHCHLPERNASNTGLYLDYWQGSSLALGINKRPVSAGPGTGNMSFVVVPGKPEESILLFRMISQKPGIQMPDLGRMVRHQEGIDLVRQWIEEGAVAP